MKEEFVKFLKKYKAYKKFCANVLNPEVGGDGVGFDEWVECAYWGAYTSGAFIWESTPEDREYWKKLDGLWREYYENIKNETS